MELRPYQSTAVEALRESIRQGRRRLILCAPCGAGKTVLVAEMIRSASAKGRTCAFLVHMRQLVNQASDKLRKFGVPHGIIMGSDKRTDYSAPVQVATIQTLASRWKRGTGGLPPADLLIVDEAHMAGAESYVKVLEAYPKAVVIGLTATPRRQNGKALGDLFDEIVSGGTYEDLIRQGYLVPSRVFAPSIPDLKGVKIRGGDYEEKALADRMDRSTVTGDVVKNWIEHGENRPTFVYGVTIAHSQHLCEQFIAAGVKADHVDGEMDDIERNAVLDKFRAGDLTVVCNCNLFAVGSDEPMVSCLCNARPTKSLVLYRQISGRVMRPFPDKRDSIIFDHSGACYEHGLPSEDLAWTLDERTRDAKKAEAETRAGSTVHCKSCHCQYPAGLSACPECGQAAPVRRRRLPKQRAGSLSEIRRDQAVRSYSLPEKQATWAKCVHIARARGQRIAVASGMFKRTFGHWPDAIPGLKAVPSWRDADVPATEWYFTRMHGGSSCQDNR